MARIGEGAIQGETSKTTPAQTNLDAAGDSKGLALLLFSLIWWSLLRFVPWNRWLRPATLPFWMARRDCRRYSSRALRALWLLSSSAALERRTGRDEREQRVRKTGAHPSADRAAQCLYSYIRWFYKCIDCDTLPKADSWMASPMLQTWAHL